MAIWVRKVLIFESRFIQLPQGIACAINGTATLVVMILIEGGGSYPPYQGGGTF
jgi:hypothetical protein